METSIKQSNNGKNNGKVEINGKIYQTVAYRLAEFRKKYPIESGWSIETECTSVDEKKVTFKATIKTPEKDNRKKSLTNKRTKQKPKAN